MFTLSQSTRVLRSARPRALRVRSLSAASPSGSSSTRSSVAVAADATAPAEAAKPYDAIPGPKGLPVFGNFFEVLKGPEPIANFHMALHQLYMKYGRLVRYNMLGQRRLMVADPEDIATVFRNAGKFPLREPVVPLNLYFARRKMTNGLVTNDGPEWRRQRLLLNPAMMRPLTIETYAPRISETSSDLAELINKNRDQTTGELKNLEPLLFRWGIESVGTVLFAQRLGALSPDGSVNPRAQKMIDAATAFFDSMAALMLGFPYYRLPVLGYHTPTWKKFEASLDQLFAMGREFVSEKLERLAKKEDELNPNLKDGGDFVSYMLSKPNVTVDEIVEHALQLLSAAADTTSNAVLSCLYHAAIHPEAQEALRKQILDVVGDSEVVTAEHLSQMPYLRGFIKECFRVWPATLGNVRVLDQDLVLRGYNVPKGVVFFFPSYSIGRDPLNFPEPLKFDPLRWAKAEETDGEEVVAAPSQAPPAKCPITGKESAQPADSAPNPFTVLPFGFGARMCIGSKVAYLEIEQALVHVLRRFHLSYTQARQPQLKTRLLMGLDMPLVLNYTPLK